MAGFEPAILPDKGRILQREVVSVSYRLIRLAGNFQLLLCFITILVGTGGSEPPT